MQEAHLAGRELVLLVLRDGESSSVPAARVVTLSAQLFNATATTETPQGVMAVARAGLCSLDEARQRASAAGWPLLMLDRVQDPGNVGTIVRSAVAAGAPALALLPGTADPLGPKAIRASAGNVFRIALANASWRELRGLRGCGMSASAQTTIYDAPIEQAEMIVLGSEAHGLSADGLDLVSIPMEAGVESLNVAAAAAVLLFELRRRLHR